MSAFAIVPDVTRAPLSSRQPSKSGPESPYFATRLGSVPIAEPILTPRAMGAGPSPSDTKRTTHVSGSSPGVEESLQCA